MEQNLKFTISMLYLTLTSAGKIFAPSENVQIGL